MNTQCVVFRTSASWTSRCCASYCLPWRLDLSLVHRFGDNVARHTELIVNRSVAQRYTETSVHRIVFASIIICIEELFEPLQKFEIVLEATFYQFIHRNYLQFETGKEKNGKQIENADATLMFIVDSQHPIPLNSNRSHSLGGHLSLLSLFIQWKNIVIERLVARHHVNYQQFKNYNIFAE